MYYQMFNEEMISNLVLKYATEKSYRHLSRLIADQFPERKISASKLCRIANRQQDFSVRDIEVFINIFDIHPMDLFTRLLL